MGTHPIFESDFDCLTENVAHNLRGRVQHPTQSGGEKSDSCPSSDWRDSRRQVVKSGCTDALGKIILVSDLGSVRRSMRNSVGVLLLSPSLHFRHAHFKRGGRG